MRRDGRKETWRKEKQVRGNGRETEGKKVWEEEEGTKQDKTDVCKMDEDGGKRGKRKRRKKKIK